MKLNRSLRAGAAAIVAALAFGFSARAQIPAQENAPTAHSAGSPPQYLNVVHERLKPGHGAAYDGMLSSIRESYERFNIPAYWIELKSITGPDEGFSLNFGDSFGDLEKMGAGMAAVLRLIPSLPVCKTVCSRKIPRASRISSPSGWMLWVLAPPRSTLRKCACFT